MEVDCLDSHTQTEKTNKNNQKDDNMMNEDTDSSGQTSDKCIENKKDIPEKCIAEADEYDTDDEWDNADFDTEPTSNDNGDHGCDICGKCFLKEVELYIHERYYCCPEEPRTVFCEICKTDLKREEVKQHAKDHARKMIANQKSTETDSSSTEDEDDKYECDQCHWAFKTQKKLHAHMYREEFERMRERKPFMCCCCERFKTEAEYKSHKRNCPSTDDYNHHYDENNPNNLIGKVEDVSVLFEDESDYEY